MNVILIAQRKTSVNVFIWIPSADPALEPEKGYWTNLYTLLDKNITLKEVLYMIYKNPEVKFFDITSITVGDGLSQLKLKDYIQIYGNSWR